MRDEEINKRIAEFVGTADRWTVMKRGLYYRPDAKGYTNRVEEAWILTEAEADQETYPYDEPVTKHRLPIPNYCSDLNAMHEAENSLDGHDPQKTSLRYHYSHHLYNIVVPKDVQPFRATARQRAEAFLRTIGKWQEVAGLEPAK